MLALLLKNSKGRQDALLIFASTAILTILYLCLLRYADQFPSGVPEIFTFIYGIFITIDAHALLSSLDKRAAPPDDRQLSENLYSEDIQRYDLLIKEVKKEIELLEGMTPQPQSGEQEKMISRQIDSFRARMFHIQEEKFAEMEKLIRQSNKKHQAP